MGAKKDKTYRSILNAALELDFKKGHLKWTISLLARKSKVTRSLIYYYFGRSKIGIVKEAVKLIGEEFVGLSERRLQMWREGQFEATISEARKMFEKSPYILSFYTNYRDHKNEIGDALIAIENEFLKKIAQFMPKLSGPEIKAIFSLYFGIVFSPVYEKKSMEFHLKILNEIYETYSPYLKLEGKPEE